MNEKSTDSMRPQRYSRRVLLVVTGLTPHVVTETLYALAVDNPNPWVPTEIEVITTSQGAELVRSALLSEHPGWFTRICTEYQLPSIQFSDDNIHIIHDHLGLPLSDIRRLTDSENAADQIIERVRTITSDANCALHVSMAGGRKTMGYYAGYALSLFGRPQDCLSHVLVSEPFESCSNFFFPTSPSCTISMRDNQSVDTTDAKITLAEIPFLRLRENLPNRFRSLQSGSASFTEVVDAMQQALKSPAITLDYRTQSLTLTDCRTVKFSGADFAFYAWLARRAKQCSRPVRIPPRNHHRWALAERADYVSYLQEYLAEAQRTDIRDGTGTELRAVGAMTYPFFHQRKTSIRDCLESAIGPLAERYAVTALVEGRPALYGLNINAPDITFIEDTQ